MQMWHPQSSSKAKSNLSSIYEARSTVYTELSKCICADGKGYAFVYGSQCRRLKLKWVSCNQSDAFSVVVFVKDHIKHVCTWVSADLDVVVDDGQTLYKYVFCQEYVLQSIVPLGDFSGQHYLFGEVCTVSVNSPSAHSAWGEHYNGRSI